MKMMPNNQRERAIIIPCDVIVHTRVHPFCQDMACLCHESDELIAEVNQYVTNGLLTEKEADRLYRGRQV